MLIHLDEFLNFGKNFPLSITAIIAKRNVFEKMTSSLFWLSFVWSMKNLISSYLQHQHKLRTVFVSIYYHMTSSPWLFTIILFTSSKWRHNFFTFIILKNFSNLKKVNYGSKYYYWNVKLSLGWQTNRWNTINIAEWVSYFQCNLLYKNVDQSRPNSYSIF